MNETELRAAVGSAVSFHGVPGVAVGVVAGEQRIVVCSGSTNVEHPLPVDAGTLFQVGSISKTITSAAVMLLVEAGDLSLDDSVASRLPDLSLPALDLDSMTIEHLLSHQSGFDGDHLFVHGAERIGALDAARVFFAPGDGFSYSNAGFTLAALVVEAVSGQDYETFVASRLFVPLGMVGAMFTADDAITHRVAAPHLVVAGEGYVLRGAGWQPGWELARLDRAAGGLVASVDDLLTWCRFQWTGAAADGTVLISRAGLERLHRPLTVSDVLDDIALDWFVRDIDGTRTIGHGGVTVGYISDLMVVVDQELGIVVLTNSTNGAGLIHDVRTEVLLAAAGLDDAGPELPAAPIDVPDSLPGTYAHSFADVVVTAGERPGTIIVAEHRRSDVTDGWLPPTDAPVTATLFAQDQALVDSEGAPRILRFGTEGSHGPWIQWRGRRALRHD